MINGHFRNEKNDEFSLTKMARHRCPETRQLRAAMLRFGRERKEEKEVRTEKKNHHNGPSNFT